MELKHLKIPTNTIELHCAVMGEGPLVIFCHGFPGLWYSFRHQLEPVAKAGFRAVAIDQRGFGFSDRPEVLEAYDSEQHCQDLIGLLNYFGEEKAIFVGHDFGAPLVWNMAVRYPEKCHAIVPIACPYDFDLAGRNGGGEDTFTSANLKPSEVFAQIAQHHFIHLHYFQEKGPADRELAENAREFLMRIYWALSAKGNLLGWEKFPSEGTGYLDVLAPAPALPWDWMSESDFDYLLEAYQSASKEDAFLGGLNNYRVADRNWEIGAQYAKADIEVPTLFVSGALDPVLQMVGPDALENMREKVKLLKDIVLIENAGHFVQSEQIQAFNDALMSFLGSLDLD